MFVFERMEGGGHVSVCVRACVRVRLQEVLVRQAGCAGSVWLGSAGSEVVAPRTADAVEKDAMIPPLFRIYFLFHLCVQDDTLQRTHSQAYAQKLQ